MSVDGPISPPSSPNTQFTHTESKKSAKLEEKDLITDKARVKGLTENNGAPIADNIIDMQRKRTKDGKIIKVTAKVAVNIKIGNKFLKQVVVLDVGDLDYYNKLKPEDKTGYLDKTQQLTHFVANLKMLIADGQNYESLQEFQERVVGITPSGDPDKPPRHFLGVSNGIYSLARHHFDANNPIWQKYLAPGKWFFQSRAWSTVRGGVEIAHVNKSGHDLFSNQGLSRARFIDGAGHVAGQIITREEFPNYANLKQGLSDEDLESLYSQYVGLSESYNTISAKNIREQQTILENREPEIESAKTETEREVLKALRDQAMANLNETNEMELNNLYIGISALMGCEPNPMVLEDQQKLVKSQNGDWLPTWQSTLKENALEQLSHTGLINRNLLSKSAYEIKHSINRVGTVAGRRLTKDEFLRYANLKPGLTPEQKDDLFIKFEDLSEQYNGTGPITTPEDEIKHNNLYIGLSLLMGFEPSPKVLKEQQQLVKSKNGDRFPTRQSKLIENTQVELGINQNLLSNTLLSNPRGLETLQDEIEAIASLLEWEQVSGIDSEGDIEAEREHTDTGLEFERTDKAVEALGLTPKEGIGFSRKSPVERNHLYDVSTHGNPSHAFVVTTDYPPLEA
jgi:hypothetical protein